MSNRTKSGVRRGASVAARRSTDFVLSGAPDDPKSYVDHALSAGVDQAPDFWSSDAPARHSSSSSAKTSVVTHSPLKNAPST